MFRYRKHNSSQEVMREKGNRARIYGTYIKLYGTGGHIDDLDLHDRDCI